MHIVQTFQHIPGYRGKQLHHCSGKDTLIFGWPVIDLSREQGLKGQDDSSLLLLSSLSLFSIFLVLRLVPFAKAILVLNTGVSKPELGIRMRLTFKVVTKIDLRPTNTTYMISRALPILIPFWEANLFVPACSGTIPSPARNFSSVQFLI